MCIPAQRVALFRVATLLRGGGNGRRGEITEIMQAKKSRITIFYSDAFYGSGNIHSIKKSTVLKGVLGDIGAVK